MKKSYWIILTATIVGCFFCINLTKAESVIVYPVNSGSIEGYGENWATARSGENSSTYLTDLYIGADYEVGNGYFCDRSFFSFYFKDEYIDIESIKLYVLANYRLGNYSSNNIKLVEMTPFTNGETSWNNFLSTTTSDTLINYSSWVPDQFVSFTFNDYGLSTFNKNGYSYYGLRNYTNDILNTTPSFNAWYEAYSSASLNTAQKPYLLITFTRPTTTILDSNDYGVQQLVVNATTFENADGTKTTVATIDVNFFIVLFFFILIFLVLFILFRRKKNVA